MTCHFRTISCFAHKKLGGVHAHFRSNCPLDRLYACLPFSVLLRANHLASCLLCYMLVGWNFCLRARGPGSFPAWQLAKPPTRGEIIIREISAFIGYQMPSSACILPGLRCKNRMESNVTFPVVSQSPKYRKIQKITFFCICFWYKFVTVSWKAV